MDADGVRGVRRRAVEWYGYQVLLADLAVIAAVVESKDWDLAVLGWFGAPVAVHVAHRNRLGALVSPVLRVSLPLVGDSVGGEGGVGEPEGYLFGMLASLIIDYTALSTTRPAGEKAVGEGGDVGVLVVPGLGVSQGRLRVGMTARFL